MTRHAKGAVLALAAAMTVPVFAQSSSSDSSQSSQSQSQSLDQVRQSRKSQMQSEGSRMIQVQEKAVWGLTEVAKDRMFMAMRHIIEEPMKAKQDLMILADVIELHQAVAQSGGGSSQTGGSSSVAGSSSDSPMASGSSGSSRSGSQSQWADQVRDAAMRIEFKQLVTKQELQQSLAQAAIALAQTQYQIAQQGLREQSANRTAYPLMYAGEFLGIAHTLSDKKPSDQVAKAIYDAQTLGHQLVALSQPTTGQQSGRSQASKQSIDDLAQAAAGQMSGSSSGGQSDMDRASDRASDRGLDRASGQSGGQSKMHTEAQRVVQQFGQALQQAQSTIGTSSGGGSSSSGSSSGT